MCQGEKCMSLRAVLCEIQIELVTSCGDGTILLRGRGHVRERRTSLRDSSIVHIVRGVRLDLCHRILWAALLKVSMTQGADGYSFMSIRTPGSMPKTYVILGMRVQIASR